MEARLSKHIQKKTSSSEKSVSTKKAQLHKKKKRQHRKCEGKDIGKSSTSPDAEAVMSDLATDVESDVSATSKEKTIITINKYPHVMTNVKQNQRKWSSNSPKLNGDKKQLNHCSTSSQSTKLCSTSCSKGAKKETVPKQSAVSYGGLPADFNLQSLRWDYELSDSESEQDRIRVYKLNRRKRYLAMFRRNYSEWLASGITGDGSFDIQETTTMLPEQASKTSSQRKLLSNRGLGQEIVIKGMAQGVKLSYTKLNQDIMIKC